MPQSNNPVLDNARAKAREARQMIKSNESKSSLAMAGEMNERSGRVSVPKAVSKTEERQQKRGEDLRRVFKELDIDSISLVPKRDIALLGQSHAPSESEGIWSNEGLRQVWSHEDHTELVRKMRTDEKVVPTLKP